MGNNVFAPFSTNPNIFLVQNIGINPQKTISIFNYPIPYLGTRDLLRIPGIAESEIRASLLKGTLNHKIKTGEVIVLLSDIDLTQYNTVQKAFLMSAGITIGLGQTGGSGITAQDHETLRQLIHFIDSGGPGDGFSPAPFKVIAPFGSPFPTNITWYIDSTQIQKIVVKIIVYNANKTPNTIQWNMYGTDGSTIVESVIDSFAYSGIFETSRTRTVLI